MRTISKKGDTYVSEVLWYRSVHRLSLQANELAGIQEQHQFGKLPLPPREDRRVDQALAGRKGSREGQPEHHPRRGRSYSDLWRGLGHREEWSVDDQAPDHRFHSRS